ncbi:RES family NAD+ phosphorylase (plasmid) [Pantoea agglomerans]|nr:RES family NAD+ phosphorylase [Pantoea agglomerans]WIL44524.1 RES family NAD+ phosphorylase [Pantoea agglomerans]
MAIWTVNLDEAESVKKSIESIFKTIITKPEALKNIKEGGHYYAQLKEYFIQWLKFLQTVNEFPLKTPFYRVRKLNDALFSGVPDIKGLKYAPKGLQLGRMNNSSINVMYTSFHEYTAISESRLEEGDRFQLTRFQSNRPVKYHELNMFSRLYFSTPRDSAEYKEAMRTLFRMEGTDTAVRGFASLESALMDGLYANHEDPEISYLVSSIISDAIFTAYTDIDAVVLPSMQQRFGINVCFRETAADNLDITFSCVNQVEKVYNHGFYRYHTETECLDFTKEPLSYRSVNDKHSNAHYTYR